MHFDELHITNWKGARCVHLHSIGDVTVIVGPNGCGKTSILEAFAMFADAAPSPLTEDLFVRQRAHLSCLTRTGRRITRNPDTQARCFPAFPEAFRWLNFHADAQLRDIDDVLTPSDYPEKPADRAHLAELLQEFVCVDAEVQLDEESSLAKWGETICAMRDLSAGIRRVLLCLFTLGRVRRENAGTPLGVILDSPETHLNAKLMGVCHERLMQLVFPPGGPAGQLIMATHSPFVLGLCANEWIRPIEIYRGRNQVAETCAVLDTKGRAYADLVGDDLLRTAAAEFSEFGSERDFSTFIDECMGGSFTVDEARNGDSQITQVTAVLASKAREELTVLDWGAGTGRSALGVLRAFERCGTAVRYVAYEPDSQNAARLRDRMREKQRVVEVREEPPGDLAQACDIVLLSNVLHEVRIVDVASTLSQIRDSLAPTGLLVLQEHELVKGEAGFVLFNSDELRAMIGAGVSPRVRTRSGIELLFFCVRRADWARGPTNGDVGSALRMVVGRSMSEIERFRTSRHLTGVTRRDAVRHAFHHALLVNAVIAEKRLSGA